MSPENHAVALTKNSIVCNPCTVYIRDKLNFNIATSHVRHQ